MRSERTGRETARGELTDATPLGARDDKWFAYDVSVEGASLVNNCQGSFGSIVTENGMSGLIDALDEEVNVES